MAATDPPPFDTHQHCIVQFTDNPISTIVTRNPLIVVHWLAEIESRHRRSPPLHRLIVGLDIQYRRPFACRRPPATIHLCVAHHCLIFQFLYPWFIPTSLVQFFNSPNHTFVGVGIKHDLQQIQFYFEYGIDPPSIVDLAELAAARFGEKELRSAGLGELANRVLGVPVLRSAETARSRWDDMHLSESQVRYACTEAFLSFEIGRVLNV